MKTHRVASCFAAILAAVCLPAAAPRAHASDLMASYDVENILTSGPWKVSGNKNGWSARRVFNSDGTFTNPDNGKEHGKWTYDADKNQIALVFADKHVDIMLLPIDPICTHGTSDKGEPTTYVMVKLPAPKYTAAPGAMSDLQKAAAALLCSGPWRVTNIVYPGWTPAVRDFNKDGTFTTEGTTTGGGNWSIDVNAKRQPYRIILAFKNVHYDSILLPLDPKGTHGTDEHGDATMFTLVSALPAAGSTAGNTAPSASGVAAFGSTIPGAGNAAPQPPQPAANPVAPEVQEKAADLVKTYHDSLVFVTGKEGSGSGFIAAMGGSNFLVTNAHVAAEITDAAFKTLDNTPVKPGTASVAVGRDIFCMAQPAGGKPLEIMQDVETNAGIGDDVVVLGNAEGEGVINTIMGKIVGIGADRVEVDAPFVPGNSGSPIIHLKSGKVIGVATYLVVNNYDTTTSEKNTKPVVRRFGYRLDKVKQWQAVDWRSFYAQAAEMDKIETLTGDLYDFFLDLEQNKGVVTPERHTNPVIKTRIDQWLADKTRHMSAEDENTANANFLSFLKVACQSDVTAARQHMSYDYFRRELADEQQDRDAMSKAFEEIIKDLRD